MNVQNRRFWKNAGIVMLGTLISQLLPLAVLPFITRTLAPEDVGVYFTWLGAGIVFAVVCGLRIDMAILQAKQESAASRLLPVSLFLCLTVSVFIYLILETIPEEFWPSSVYSLHQLTLEVVILAAILGANGSLNAFFVRNAEFKRQAYWKVWQGLLIALFQVAFLVLGFRLEGIVYGQLLALILVTISILFSLRKEIFAAIQNSSLMALVGILVDIKRFPLISMPSALINMLSSYLPLFLITGRIGAAEGAAYGLTHKTLSGPLSLIGGSMISAFREQASRSYRETGQCIASYTYTLRSLFLIGIFPFGGLYFFGEEIFRLVFGDEWDVAGKVAELLAPMFMVRFIASPLSYMFFLKNKQHLDFMWQVAYLVLTAFIFLVVDNLTGAVLYYSICGVVMYMVNIYMSFVIASGRQFFHMKLPLE